MGGRHNHFSNASIFFSFLIVGIVLFFLPRNQTAHLSLAFYDTFESVLRIGRDIQMEAIRLHPGNEETVTKSEYTRLWKNFNNLHAQLLSLHEDYERQANIRSALPSAFDPSALSLAKITGAMGNFSHEFVINQGSNSHIRPGQFVLSESTNCLIGMVTETAETTAKVRLLTDAMQTLEIRIRRQGTDMDIPAMMVGNGKDGCKIPNMVRDIEVHEGDTVYASEVPGRLNCPLIVGEVSQVQRDDKDPLLWDVTVEIAEDLSRLNKVAVIIADESLLLNEN